MKALKKVLSGVCAVALLAGMTACSNENTTDTEIPEEETALSVAISSETTIEVTVQAESENTEPELPVTNADGEVTIDGATFNTIYGSQLGNYLNHQYYYDGKAIPVAESNFYFIHEFTDLSTQAYQTGRYPITIEGFVDLAYEFDNGQLDTFSFNTFGDYFREFSENQILSTYIVLDLAAEDGLELSKDTKDEIDEYVGIIKENAKNYGLTLDQYLGIFYGPDCDEAAFHGILERYYLSTLYSDEYISNYEFEEDELYVPKVCHALFMAIDGTATEEEDKIALEAATNMLGECESPSDIMELGNVLKASDTVAECAEYSVTKGIFVPEFEGWAYDESRQIGDMGIVKTTYGYHVMGYLGTVEIDEASKTNIALAALNDEIGSIAFSNVHEFYTPDTIITPDPVLEISDEIAEIVEATTTEASLNLDADGNIVLDTSATLASDAVALDTTTSVPAPKKTIGIVAVVVGVVALVAACCFTVTSIVKGKKIDIDDQEDDRNNRTNDSEGEE